MFAQFRRRVTRAYVLLAVGLILLIFGSTSALTIVLYARSSNDALVSAAQRASSVAAQVMKPGVSLEQGAPQILQQIGHSRFHIAIIDTTHRIVAQNGRERPREGPQPLVVAFAEAAGLPPQHVDIPGGAILIAPDFDRFAQALAWYWEIAVPIGLLAVAIAWFAGRRITARAIGPLAGVTQALGTVAAGDFSPQPLAQRGGDLPELTDAYNQVAFSLAAASAERARTETQMRQFIADAGHELRTPLTIVMGYLEALQQGIVQDPQARERTYETMLSESRRMRKLIEKLILLARLERAVPASPAQLDLSNLTRRAAASLEPLAPDRISVEGAETPLEVRANEDELFEAIKNAIDNAVKYAPGSPVRVTLSRDGRGKACVEIADTGPGMDPQDAAHAFDRFYRGAGRSDVDGSGLGLAIAKIAVERAGGSVSLDSVPGEGTTVRFCLPVAGTG